MWRLPITRAPASGFCAPYCRLSAMSPGISCSARRISFRPKSASARSFTLKGSRPAAFAAAKGCSFSTTVAIVLSPLCTSGRDEQSRTFRSRIGGQRHDGDLLEPSVAEQAADVRLRETEPDVAHLLLVAFAVVGEHVGDHDAAAGCDDARGFGQRACRIGHMVQHEHHQRRVEPAVVDRQRLEIASTQIDVVEALYALLRR